MHCSRFNYRFVFIFLTLTIFATVKEIMAWGGGGTPLTITQFASGIVSARQIAVDSNGNVFQSGYEGCCTAGNKGIAKYNSSGTFITKFGAVDSTGVAVDGSGNVYVIDYQQDDVEKYDNNGNEIDISGTDFNNAAYSSPYAAAIDSDGNIYVANAGTNTILKFNSSLASAGTITGNGGAFNFPEAVAVDGSNNLYVLDSGNNRVQKFNSSGTFLFQVTGNGGAWNYPEAMTVDSEGNLFVGDSGNDRIQIFNSSGVFQQEITAATINASAPTLGYYTGMGMRGQGTLYAGDQTRSLKITFDVTAPSVSITAFSGDTTGDTTPVFTGSVSDSATVLTAIEYTIDSGSYSSCAADDGSIDEQSETYSCTVSTVLSAGSHTLTVRASDSKTNTASTTYSYTVSTTTPAVTPAPTVADTTSPPSGCSAIAPLSSPNLFSLIKTSDEATLYFTPVGGTVTGYQIAYGYSLNEDNFNVSTPTGAPIGALSYTINYLEPNKNYYFRVRAMNDCVPGPWSNSLTTTGNGIISTPTPSGTVTTIQPTSSTISPTTTLTGITTPSPEITDTPTGNTVMIVVVDLNGEPISDVVVTVTEAEPGVVEDAIVVVNSPSIGLVESIPDNLKVTVQEPGNTEQLSNLVTSVLGDKTDSRGVVVKTITPGDYEVRVVSGTSSFTFPSVNIAQNQTSYIRLPVDRASLFYANPLPKIVKGSETISAGLIKTSGISLIAFTVYSLVTSLFVIYSTLMPVYAEIGVDAGRLSKELVLSFGRRFRRYLDTLAYIYVGEKYTHRLNNGLVFNSLTHRPVSGAYVVLYSPYGNLTTDFTDHEGRYFIKPEPSTYKVKVEALHYRFPSQLITAGRDSVYNNVYIPGKMILVTEMDKEALKYSLPLDPKFSVLAGNFIRIPRNLVIKTSPLLYLFLMIVLLFASMAPTGLLYRFILGLFFVHIFLRTYRKIISNINLARERGY